VLSFPFPDTGGFAVSTFAPLDAAVGVAHHLVTGLADAVAPVFGGAAAAAAVVLVTAAVRLLLVPLRLRQFRADRTRPFAGLLPALAQAPFVLVLYRVFATSTPGALLGVPLGDHWTSGALFGPHAVVFAVLVGLLVLLGWWSARRLGDAPLLMRLLPYGTAVVALVVPLAAGLYLVTSTAWTALELAVFNPPPPPGGTPPA
jgi:YidC/Oxa1 family membrane protein insertase